MSFNKSFSAFERTKVVVRTKTCFYGLLLKLLTGNVSTGQELKKCTYQGHDSRFLCLNFPSLYFSTKEAA